MAVVILASPHTPTHSLKLRLVVRTTKAFSYSLLSRWHSSAPPNIHLMLPLRLCQLLILIISTAVT